MANLFKKAIVFTDLHLGLKSNSTAHNEDCLAFVDWAITVGKEQGCDTCLFLGDWHNNRASINLVTLDYSIRALERISAAFSQTFFIPGNHDLYYRDKRDIQSAAWARHIPNIHIVNDFFNEGNVCIAPWLVHDEHKKINKMKGEYMFGHFELPHFYMNAMVQMPDHGDIQREHFENFERVYSGHFHKRQHGKNITYIGNCFPHNYSDAGDDERGVSIMEWGKEEEFLSWPDQPRYRVYSLSGVLTSPEELLKPKMHVRVNLDIEISYEEATFIKETFADTYKLREITLIQNKANMDSIDVDPSELNFRSVDQIVSEQIAIINSDHFDPKLLLDIYRNL
jgi:DNA repair exonuclease SbcCD nuclease subunit